MNGPVVNYSHDLWRDVEDNTQVDASWSTSSIIATGNCCTPGTSFRCRDGTFACVKSIPQYEMLAGHAGEDLEVLEAPLRTGVADLLVTKNDRIVVLRCTLQTQ